MIQVSSIIGLIFLEVILSVDNLIFISTIVSSMDGKYKGLTKFIGLGLALGIRLGLLFSVNTLLQMDKILFYIGSMDVTYKETVFIIGGLFLIYKATGEARQIVANEKVVENHKSLYHGNSAVKKFFFAVLQIILVDLIFSIDSVIVAIAIAPDMRVIIIATLVSMATLLVSTNFLAKILTKYPSIKLLAMSFIIAIGIIFVLDGFEIHIDRSYIHFALLFSLIFESFDIIRLKNLNESTEKKDI